jgi:hypothetical protein
MLLSHAVRVDVRDGREDCMVSAASAITGDIPLTPED